MHMVTKHSIFQEKLQEYLKANKLNKGLLLGAITNVTGLSRKSAIKRFRRLQLYDSRVVTQRGRPRYYTNDVLSALKESGEREISLPRAVQKPTGAF